MSNLSNQIKEIERDLSSTITDKKRFLAQCAYLRIKERNLSYDNQFDQYLRLLESTEVSCNDLEKVSRSLRSLSRLVSSSYNEISLMIKNYEKNIFHKGT